jgi:quercetin dioxygenase-like cupin family protein
MSDEQLTGIRGDGWCVIPPGFGPPDQVDGMVMRWLLIPGPPMSCTLVHSFAIADAAKRVPYHMHTKTWSIHVCIAGRGLHYAEGQANEIVPGTVFYEAPNAVHTLVPVEGHTLTQVCIQYPCLGYEDETKIVPEAGTLDRFGDVDAFRAVFGPDAASYKRTPQLFRSERWLEFVSNAQKARK